jgi:hypothetical protein
MARLKRDLPDPARLIKEKDLKAAIQKAAFSPAEKAGV